MTRTAVFIAAIVLLPLAVGCNAHTDPPPEAADGPGLADTPDRPASRPANTASAARKATRGVELSEPERMAELLAYLKKKGFALTQGARRGRRYLCVIDSTPDGCEAYTTFVVLASDSNDRDNQRLYEGGGSDVAFALPAVYNPHCKMAMFWPQVRCTSGVKCPALLLRLRDDDSDFITAFKTFRPRDN